MDIDIVMTSDPGDSEDVVKGREEDLTIAIEMSWDVKRRSLNRRPVGPSSAPTTVLYISRLTFESPS